MHLLPRLALLSTLLTAIACRRPPHYTPPEAPLPPNTILLSQMMRELSARPGFTEALLAELDSSARHPNKRGPALLTPDLADDLRQRILGKDWERLDRFPGWTMRAINPTVRVASNLAGSNDTLESASEIHPGSSPSSAPTAAPRTFLDLGPYDLDPSHSQTVSLDDPPDPRDFPPFTTAGIVTDLGAGVTRGDGPSDLAPQHAQSQRLAVLLNRLAANALPTARPFTVTLRGQPATTPSDLIAALTATGHSVTVIDARYFANFGHLHSNGRDVMAPFWIDTNLIIPNSGGRHLLVPVSHAELEWQIRPPAGHPGITADVSWYFGIDGKAEWRTMDTLDQPWVLKRAAHTYAGPLAFEATRLASLFTVAYMHQHQARPDLPFGGYYALGVCQDAVSAIEHHIAGHSTLFPNTADTALFNDPRDAQVNALLASIPKDRDGVPPEPERIFGSLPTTPGPNGDFSAITIPGLAADLQATHQAWLQGTLNRAVTRNVYLIALTGATAILLALCTIAALRPRKRWD